MKWTKVLLSVAAVTTAGAILVGKSIRDKKQKDELDAFLLPEEEDAIQIDVPIKDQTIIDKILDDIKSIQLDEDLQASLSFQCTTSKGIDQVSNFCSNHNLSASFNLEDGLIDIDLIGQVENEYVTMFDELRPYFQSGELRYLGAHYTKD